MTSFEAIHGPRYTGHYKDLPSDSCRSKRTSRFFVCILTSNTSDLSVVQVDGMLHVLFSYLLTRLSIKIFGGKQGITPAHCGAMDLQRPLSFAFRRVDHCWRMINTKLASTRLLCYRNPLPSQMIRISPSIHVRTCPNVCKAYFAHCIVARRISRIAYVYHSASLNSSTCIPPGHHQLGVATTCPSGMVARVVNYGQPDGTFEAVVKHTCDECGPHGQCPTVEHTEQTVVGHAFASKLQAVAETLCAGTQCKALNPSVFTAIIGGAAPSRPVHPRLFVVFRITNVQRCGMHSRQGTWPEAVDLPAYISQIGFCELSQESLLPLPRTCRVVNAPHDPRYCFLCVFASLLRCFASSLLHNNATVQVLC